MRQLLVEMRDELKRFLLARQCDPADVDDLLQDLFVKLTTAKTGPIGNPRAYLYQMANNLLLDRRRGRQRQARRDDSWARSQFGQDLREDPAASPERVAIDRNLLAQVDATLREMPERTADILRRYRLEGQSQKVIAEEIGISLSAVEKHLQRAYRALLELRGGIEDEPCDEVPEVTDERISSDAIEQRALAWHLRLRDADADEWREFTAWLTQDPAHNDAYEAVALRDEQFDQVLAQASFPEPATDAQSDAQDGRTAPPNRLRWLALAASVAFVMFLAVRFLAPGADSYAIETEPGEMRTIALADGGAIVVNGGSHIVLDRRDERVAELVKGEAHFTVMHDAADPFVVTVGESRLVDVGTIFNVVRHGEDLRVAVAEGAVRYEGAVDVELAAGQAMHRMANGRVEVTRRKVDAIGSWVDGTLVYDRAPLGEVAADLTRTTGIAIDLAPGLEHRRFSGVIQTGGDPASLRDRVAAVLGLTVDANEAGWTVRP